MNTCDLSLTYFKNWLLNHIETMDCPDAKCRRAFASKRVHSIKVAEEIVEIGRRMRLDRRTLFLSGVIGLLHDVGRFEQFKTYSTFNDYASVDHGELGARTIEANGALKGLRPDERTKVVKAIRWHNKIKLPEEADEQTMYFARVIRDADKLDIYRVVVEGLSSCSQDAVLPAGDDISDALHADLMAGRQVCYKDIRSSTEMRLMQLHWVTDINFKSTLDLIEERNYFHRIAASLPATVKIHECLDRLKRWLSVRH